MKWLKDNPQLVALLVLLALAWRYKGRILGLIGRGGE